MGEQDFNGYAEVYRAVFRVHVISARSKQTTGRRPQTFLSPRNAIQFFRATLTSSTLPYSLERNRPDCAARFHSKYLFLQATLPGRPVPVCRTLL